MFEYGTNIIKYFCEHFWHETYSDFVEEVCSIWKSDLLKLELKLFVYAFLTCCLIANFAW